MANTVANSGHCRHGWGCTPDPAAAVNYLSAAASNAATVENLALQAGLKKGGAAKGELVLAIFELANCFRHGWGIEKDPVAAKQVRLLVFRPTVSCPATDSAVGSTMKRPRILAIVVCAVIRAGGTMPSAAVSLARCPMGFRMLTGCARHDADAMNEVAWCYLEGFGTKKDKVSHVPCPAGLPSCPRTSGANYVHEMQLHPSESQSHASDMSQAITAFKSESCKAISLWLSLRVRATHGAPKQALALPKLRLGIKELICNPQIAIAPHPKTPRINVPTSRISLVLQCTMKSEADSKPSVEQYAAAKYYRLAEQNGNKTLGNSW